MKVLQINCVYKKGSTGKITYDIHSALVNEGMDSVICYGRGDSCSEQSVYKVCSELYAKFNNLGSRITGLRYGGCFFSTRKLINFIKRENPDIVHLQCINGHFVNIYKIVKWLNDNHIKTVLSLHAEFMYTANCSHAYECNQWMNGCKQCERVKDATKTLFVNRTGYSYEKMRAAFENFEYLTVVSVSDWVKDRAKESKILKEKNHVTIFNGVDTTIFSGKHEQSEKNHQETDKKVVFHVSPMFTDQPGHNKGGEYVLKLANSMKDKDVLFVVAGKHDVKGEVPVNVKLLGEIRNPNLLAEYYASADVTLLTSKRETFSMVCAESLCCGTPVVGFQAGAPETVAIKEYSHFVKYGDLDGLKDAVLDFLNSKTLDKNIISAEACDIYSKEKMCEQYLQEYRRLL